MAQGIRVATASSLLIWVAGWRAWAKMVTLAPGPLRPVSLGMRATTIFRFGNLELSILDCKELLWQPILLAVDVEQGGQWSGPPYWRWPGWLRWCCHSRWGSVSRL